MKKIESMESIMGGLVYDPIGAWIKSFKETPAHEWGSQTITADILPETAILISVLPGAESSIATIYTNYDLHNPNTEIYRDFYNPSVNAIEWIQDSHTISIQKV